MEKPLTKGYLDKSLDKLSRMIKKGFDENTKQHQQIFDRLEKIDKKFEGIVYRFEFEKLKTEFDSRIKRIEEALAIK